MSSDDHTLLARAASGDGEALEALMASYASRIYRLAYGITRSSADAEDHLADCAPCRAYLATYRASRELGVAAARVEMPGEMKARLRRFLLDKLRPS